MQDTVALRFLYEETPEWRSVSPNEMKKQTSVQPVLLDAGMFHQKIWASV